VVTDQEIADYVMPLVEEGSPVLWYRHGLKGGCEPEVAFIAKVYHRNVTLYLISGPRATAVRHASDPKLQLNVEQREFGAWDFTEQQKEYESFREDIINRVMALEGNVPADSAEKSGSKSREYHQLREFAIKKGVPVSGNPKKEWLEDQLAAIGALP